MAESASFFRAKARARGPEVFPEPRSAAESTRHSTRCPTCVSCSVQCATLPHFAIVSERKAVIVGPLPILIAAIDTCLAGNGMT